MKCLGISCYFHDAAAALIIDGEPVAAAEEERFSRRKHDASFPVKSIRFCLDQAGIVPQDLDAVCFYEKPLRKLERVLVTGSLWRHKSTVLAQRQLARLLHEELFLERVLRETIGYRGEVSYCEHHLSHGASAYYTSGFEDAAVLTVDGVGEWATLARYRAAGSRLEPLDEIRYPHSLGLLYTTLTTFLGFRAHSDEYKVMGLAAYGTPRYKEAIRKLIRQHPDGSFALEMEHFAFPYSDSRMYTDAMIALLGEPRSSAGSIDQDHMDLAASLQAVLEEMLVVIAADLHRRTQNSRLCMAGGVALNGVANSRILESTPFEEIYIQPAAGDSGGALGAALYRYHAEGHRCRVGRHTTLLGPEFSNLEIRQILTAVGARFEELTDQELLKRAARLLQAGQIIGWFQGRMEFGPRALGCRSILANPCRPEMKDILNSRVKFREDFRPFAPAVLAEHATDYFELEIPSPHMLLIPRVRPERRALIPSVVHVDGTARVQTVEKTVNPRFYGLIEAFAEHSGVPIVLNTSFNVQGEPIVCTPKDALACFLGTDLDCLFMGSFMVTKDV